MYTCDNCGKTGSLIAPWSPQVGAARGKKFCSAKCWREYANKKSSDEKAKRDLDQKITAERKIKEIKCKCNQCEHVWHYLEDDEKKLKRQAMGNAMIGCGMCCNPLGGLFLNKSNDLQREAEKLKKCPKCGSGDIAKKEIYYDKKP